MLARFVIVLVTLLVMSLMTVWQHARSVEVGYEIGDLKKMRNCLFEGNRKLRLDVNRLKSPETLLTRLAELRPELRVADESDIIKVTEIEENEPADAQRR